MLNTKRKTSNKKQCELGQKPILPLFYNRSRETKEEALEIDRELISHREETEDRGGRGSEWDGNKKRTMMRGGTLGWGERRLRKTEREDNYAKNVQLVQRQGELNEENSSPPIFRLFILNFSPSVFLHLRSTYLQIQGVSNGELDDVQFLKFENISYRVFPNGALFFFVIIRICT